MLNERQANNKGICIKPNHAEWLYRVVMLGLILQSDTLFVLDMYSSSSTRSWFNYNTPSIDSMSQNCLQYLIRLVHFICDDIFDYSRYNNTSYYYDTASHPVKFGLIENNYMKQWHGSSVSSLDDWSPLMKVVLLDGIILCLQLDRIQNQSNRVLNFICSQIAWEKGVRPHLLWFLSQKFIEVHRRYLQ